MKKNLLFLPLVLAGLALSSCSKYDDSTLSGRVTHVEGRVAKLEEQVNALNSDIVAISTLISALEGNDYVSKVEPIAEAVRSGYRISFAKSSPITIYHGTDGRDGASGTNGRDGASPVIGVRQEAGIYYWTLNGEWLADAQGQRVKAQGSDGLNGQDGVSGTPGRDGQTPQFKIKNDYWHVSYNNGLSWQRLNVKATGAAGTAGVNAFQAVRVEDTQVTFTLTDGAQTLTLPLHQEMSLRFTNTEDYAVFPYQTYEIPYTTTGVTSDTEIKVIGQDGVRAKLFRRDAGSGVIEVTTLSNVGDTEIIVLLTDGRGYSKMYALALYQGVLTASSDNYLVESSGAELEVPIQTNIQYTIEIPSEATSWISYEKLRALTLRNERLRFRVRENPLSTLRSAVVKLRVNGFITRTITIAQMGKSKTYALTSDTSLLGLLGEDLPYELKLTSGTLTNEDFQFFKKKNDKIKILDISELPMTELPKFAFAGSKLEEVRLPKGLTAIPEGCFNASKIRRINIPQSVTSIGRIAFAGCRDLVGPLVIPQGVTSIGERAFQRCSGLSGSLVIPQGVTSIGLGAFWDCSGFTGSLVIPQGVTSIERYAFFGCSGFTGSLVIPQGVTSIEHSAFRACSGFTGSLVIPQGVTSIGDLAFGGCSGFTGSLVIPQGVTSIGWRTFAGCSGFTGSLVIPQGVTSIGWGAFGGCSGFTGSLVIPQSVTDISMLAFRACTGLDGDLIIEGNTKIREGAFTSNTAERLNFRAVYSKATTPSPLVPNAFWGGVTYGPKPQVLYIPRGTRAAYATKSWSDQFERIEETDTWPQVNR